MRTFGFRADLRLLPYSAALQPMPVRRAAHPADTRLCTVSFTRFKSRSTYTLFLHKLSITMYCAAHVVPASGTGAKWHMSDRCKMVNLGRGRAGGRGKTPSSSSICSLGNTFIFIGSEMRNLGSPFMWKGSGAGRHLPDHFLWNCMDCIQPFQQLNQLGVWMRGRKGTRGERERERERDLAPSLPDT